MRIIKTIPSLRTTLQKIKSRNKTVGFVPTMGALHEGHLSLIRKSQRENDVTVVSIFVNPTQFGPKEDFRAYPRPEKKDKLLAQKEKVDIIFYPSVEEIYGKSCLTYVEVGELSRRLCGRSRPKHFRGVATVVTKLLNIVVPDRLYLGQKDAQQAVILTKMVEDLNIPVKVCVCPTIREQDGLAISSRNQYLTTKERQEAPILFRSLKEAQKRILQSERNTTKIVSTIRKMIRKNSSGKIDYVECVDLETLQPVKKNRGRILLALAVRFGRARLIDNLVVNP